MNEHQDGQLWKRDGTLANAPDDQHNSKSDALSSIFQKVHFAAQLDHRETFRFLSFPIK